MSASRLAAFPCSHGSRGMPAARLRLCSGSAGASRPFPDGATGSTPSRSASSTPLVGGTVQLLETEQVYPRDGAWGVGGRALTNDELITGIMALRRGPDYPRSREPGPITRAPVTLPSR